MTRSTPHFRVGDIVRETFPFGSAILEKGVVTEMDELKGDYRYVVRFESREAVFFEREIILDKS